MSGDTEGGERGPLLGTCACKANECCSNCHRAKLGFTSEGNERAMRNLVESLRPDVVRFYAIGGGFIYYTRSQFIRGGDDGLIEVVW